MIVLAIRWRWMLTNHMGGIGVRGRAAIQSIAWREFKVPNFWFFQSRVQVLETLQRPMWRDGQALHSRTLLRQRVQDICWSQCDVTRTQYWRTWSSCEQKPLTYWIQLSFVRVSKSQIFYPTTSLPCTGTLIDLCVPYCDVETWPFLSQSRLLRGCGECCGRENMFEYSVNFGARACRFVIDLLQRPVASAHFWKTNGWTSIEAMIIIFYQLNLCEGLEKECFTQL